MGCHGEWLIAAQILSALPVVGIFLRPFIKRFIPARTHKHDDAA